jgi:hypothetical protein
MNEPENISYFFAHHANDRFTASYTLGLVPGLKNSHDTAPIVVNPIANRVLLLSGAAEHILLKVGESVWSEGKFIRGRIFGRKVLETESEGFGGVFKS